MATAEAATNVALHELSRQMRADILRATESAGSGHPTSSLSAVELVAVVFARYLRYSVDAPDYVGNDRFVLSKGHATPLLYAALKAIGAIDDQELLTYRDAGSRLEGHPTPRLPWVDAATGSLGQGLPIGVGMALAARMDGRQTRTFVLCGDSEMAEGSVWEAAEHAGHARLGGLVALVDVNRLGQRGPTRHGWDLSAYARRFDAFGWSTVEVGDGHDLEAIDRALDRAVEDEDRPTAVLARTIKGKGVEDVEDEPGYHGKALDQADEVVQRLGGTSDLIITPVTPLQVSVQPRERHEASWPTWDVGDEVATRDAFGKALLALGQERDDVVVLDGEVSNSTRTDEFAEAYPDRYIEAYIAEQNMVGMSIGLARSGWRPFVSSFAAFLSRAYDFVRMAPVSNATLTLVGSHAGVSIGPDGPSQMGLEDIAAMRAVANATVLYPCDANQACVLTRELAQQSGVSYLRTTRGETPVIYQGGESFPVGGSRTVRSSPQDAVTLVAAGMTVHEALAAADMVDVPVRVIDAYSVQPLDRDTIAAAARETGAVIVVEDHRPAGGLGEAVAAALLETDASCTFRHLAVTGVPGSATPDEQLREAGIDRQHIASVVGELVA